MELEKRGWFRPLPGGTRQAREKGGGALGGDDVKKKYTMLVYMYLFSVYKDSADDQQDAISSINNHSHEVISHHKGLHYHGKIIGNSDTIYIGLMYSSMRETPIKLMKKYYNELSDLLFADFWSYCHIRHCHVSNTF